MDTKIEVLRLLDKYFKENTEEIDKIILDIICYNCYNYDINEDTGKITHIPVHSKETR